MKILFFRKLFFISFIVSTFVGCNNNENILPTENDIEVVNNGTLLKFKDQATFDKTVNYLLNLDNTKRLNWSKSIGFESLGFIFANAMDEVDNMETQEDYRTFKEKYQEILYFPEYIDDYGPYLPIQDRIIPFVVNKQGIVIIGNEEKSFIDIFSYEQLQDCGMAMYNKENSSNLRSNRVQIVRSSKEYVGNQYNSDWETRGNRKLQVKVGRRVWDVNTATGQFTMNLHLEVSFRKKVLGVWVNHTCGTETNFENVQIENFQREILVCPEEGTSSHDFYRLDRGELYYRAPIQPVGRHVVWTAPTISGTAKVYYRDFGGYIKVCPFTLNYTEFEIF